ncbi:hypothetical protein O3M35_001706 [Rhynocoris fuscipes]|uniref:Small ribosomal subunit protein mS35 mitochondrial conserved domain-containing protein n=1 Tax=Rhynocoris fuscipes TaxID=488301 RepID=A0AAW1CPV3_9HEMI
MMNYFQILKTFGKYNLRCTTVNKSCCFATKVEPETDEEGFRVLDLKKSKRTTSQRRRQVSIPVMPPRESKMLPDQIWSDVWPGPRTFHPASVPLPLRQGINKLGAPPSKWANAELMKIPNFLHLTPPAVKKHCDALKMFCTKWPKGLETDEQMRKHFPLEVITMDYCYSSPSIRNPMARIVTIKFPLSCLEFDKHSRDKFLRLVGDRYDADTDIVTIVTDKCPLKKQNYEYALYLLTALYHESWITEPWESEKSEADLEYYDWDNSISKENIIALLKLTNEEPNLSSPKVNAYKTAVINLFDEGENDYNLSKYKEASLSILFPT